MTDVNRTARSESRLTPADRPWRIAFPYIHEKRSKRPNGMALEKPRYDATLLAPKLHVDPAQCQNYQILAAHCMEAATKLWGSWPAGGYWPIQDGDSPPKPKAPVPGQPVAAVDPNKYAWRKGNWIVEIGNNLDPGPRIALLQNGQAVEIPARVIAGRTLYKGGDYVVASISSYTFNKSGKFGTNFGFDGILFVGDGESIGSSGPKSAAQMFGGVANFAGGAGGAVGAAGMPPGVAAAPSPPTYSPPPAAASLGAQAPPGYHPPGPVAPVAPAPVYAPPPGPPTYAPPGPGGPLPAFPAIPGR